MAPRKKNVVPSAPENTYKSSARQNVKEKWTILYSKLLEFSKITVGKDAENWAIRTEQGIWESSLMEWKKRQGIDASVIVNEEQFTEDRDFWNTYVLQNCYAYQNVDAQGAYGNPHLWNEIRTKSIDPYQIAFMKPMERFPSRWKEVAAVREATDKYLYHTEEATSDLFRCMKCKQRKCTYTQAQLRASDEPMTTMVRCVNCGHKWRC